MKQLMKKLRGFTLMELIVVLGIIAILTAVFVPAMMGYLTKSRLNTANSDARVLFNSIQTICQEFEFNERSAQTMTFYGDRVNVDDEFTDGQLMIRCTPSGFDADSNVIYDISTRTIITRTKSGTETVEDNAALLNRLNITDSTDLHYPSCFMQRLERLFADYADTVWIVYIDNYQVKGVICATAESSIYLGGYPNKSTDREGFTLKGSTAYAHFPAESDADYSTMETIGFDEINDYARDSWNVTAAPAGS